MRGRGRVMPKERIFEKLFSFDDDEVGLNAVELYIARLRRKLAGSGLAIRNLRGLEKQGWVSLAVGADAFKLLGREPRGEEVALTAKEFGLLAYLARNAERIAELATSFFGRPVVASRCLGI